jgi:hypothetical protein
VLTFAHRWCHCTNTNPQTERDMTRQALHTPYPFHQHNPRAHVVCCRPRRLPRRSAWQRFKDEIARLMR